jgi:hypothetical protein
VPNQAVPKSVSTDSEAPHERSAQFLFFIYTGMIVQSREGEGIFMENQLTIS